MAALGVAQMLHPCIHIVDHDAGDADRQPHGPLVHGLTILLIHNSYQVVSSFY